MYNPRPAPRATPGATFAPSVTLRPRTQASYEITAGTAEQVAAHLHARGYTDVRLCSEWEAARLRHAHGAIVVVYTSGTIVCQGARPQHGHDALAPLVEVQP